jgi:hypothetical protein
MPHGEKKCCGGLATGILQADNYNAHVNLALKSMNVM